MDKKKRDEREKKEQRLEWIRLYVFPVTIVFSVGMSYDEITKHFKKVKAEEWLKGIEYDKDNIDNKEIQGQVLDRKIINKDGKEKDLFYVILRDYDLSDEGIVVLAHELIHICQFVLKRFIDTEVEYETFAYTHTYLMRECLKILR